MNQQTLIFDFDGTIADSLLKATMLYNEIAREQGLGEVTKENLPSLRGLGPREIMRSLRVPTYKLPIVLTQVRSRLASRIPFLKPFPKTREVLSELKTREYTLGILSSNSEENIRSFLRNNQLEFFDFIHSDSTIFGKARLLRQILRERNLNLDNTWYIGDEVRDMQAAKKAGVRSIAVTWGGNTKEALAALTPTQIAEQPKDLLKI